MKWLTWLVSVSVTVFLLHKGENVLGIWGLVLTVLVFLSEKLVEFSFSLQDGLKLKQLIQRVDDINEGFTQEIFLDTDLKNGNIVMLKDDPIKNSIFAYWAPIVMTEGKDFTISGRGITLHPSDSKDKPIFTNDNPLVIRYLKKI